MNHPLIIALFQNAGFLLAMVVVFDFLTSRRKPLSTLWDRILAGLASGLIGVAMIGVSARFAEGIIFDARSVLLSVTGLFFGALPTIIAVVLTAAFRLVIGGAAEWAGVLVIVASGAIGIAWRGLLRRPLEEVAWRDLYSMGLVVHLVMLGLMFALPPATAWSVVKGVGIPVMLVLPLATVTLGLLFARRLRQHAMAQELSKSEARSRQTEEKLRLALKAANQGLYDLDVRTGEETVSDEYARMLGYEPATFRETKGGWLERMHPEDRDAIEAGYEDYIAGRSPEYRVEFRQRTKSGDWIWILSLGSIVAWDDDGKPLRILGTRTDITALKKAEQQTLAAQAETLRLLEDAQQSRLELLRTVEEQRAAERELRSVQREMQRLTEILEATQGAARVGGWELDLEQNSLSWTTETFRIHDISPSHYEPALETALACYTAESLPVIRQALDAAIREGVAREVELELTTAIGRRKWVHFTTSVTRAADKVVRVTCAIQDITARKRAEVERLELTERLNQSQRLESLGSLAGGVAHDINNVLAAILSLASAHRVEVPDGEPLARSLDTIMTACVRGRSVVRSLLYFARPSIEDRRPVDLNGIVQDVVQLLESTTLKRYRFATELAAPLPPVEGDEGAITHALMNLCLNSVDAMPEGGEIAIQTLIRPDGFVELLVRDTGTGMNAEVREKAIEPFFTTKPVGKGSGLGLATVYGTMNAHRGTIRIDSVPGEGTEVVLAFPSSTETLVAPKILDPASQPMANRGLRILLVDDDELIRIGVGTLLEMEGHELHLAEDGRSAIALFESGLEVDLVILDMNMPGLTGAETLPHLLALRPGQRVLICSGHGDEEVSLLTEGRSNVLALAKPFTLEELDEKLAEAGLKG